MTNPKSHVLDAGYLHVYSDLTSQERRQLAFQRRYKDEHPLWDNTTIHLLQMLKEVIRERHGSSFEVLDAGCGHGNYLIDECRQKITWATGVDIIQEATTKNICLDETVFAPLDHLPFTNASFDVVTSLWVFEHLEHPEKALSEIARVLRPGGVVLFCTPNRLSFLLRIKSLLHSEKLNDQVNARLYGRNGKDIFSTWYRANTLRDLRRLLETCGFHVDSLRTNYDPGYTSFNGLTYGLSNILEQIGRTFHSSTFEPHIFGMARKPGLEEKM